MSSSSESVGAFLFPLLFLDRAYESPLACDALVGGGTVEAEAEISI